MICACNRAALAPSRSTWSFIAVRSAEVKVGLRRASTWPLRTMSPFLTLMLSTMVWSKGCRTILGAAATSFPLAETILSM